MNSFAAPGKAVLWGEYAVLEGAPAMVMAVDRYATCRIEYRDQGWLCRSMGMVGECLVSAAQLLGTDIPSDSPAGVVSAALRSLNANAPTLGASVTTDTTEFFAGGDKLGIGSSAAICTAVYAALAELSDLPLNFEGALHAHRLLQGGRGSGIDVAASFHGGLVRFHEGKASQAIWPEGLFYQFVWTGHSARTTDHLRRFEAWKAQADLAPLRELCKATEALSVVPTIDALNHYRLTLQHFDSAANLGIYSNTHRQLDRLAIESQVVYKPCGAGGGDIGVAFSGDPQALQHFRAVAEKNTYQTLALEIAEHGVQPTGQ